MAERSVRPAVLASRWRSRPGVVRVAAVLLGLHGLLLVLVEADQGDLDAAELVTGRGAERGAGASVALFFFACLLTAPLFAPGRRGGRLRLETLRVGDRHERRSSRSGPPR